MWDKVGLISIMAGSINLRASGCLSLGRNFFSQFSIVLTFVDFIGKTTYSIVHSKPLLFELRKCNCKNLSLVLQLIGYIH